MKDLTAPHYCHADTITLPCCRLGRCLPAVSMEDLITDLLSNPVDVDDWVPGWVRDAAATRCAAGVSDCAGLKAHQGIVSSAAAILKDMEERGLLQVGGGALWFGGVGV